MRILAEVGRRGSIAAAAQALHLTPSAVSQNVATLEREVGVALLERSSHAVRLTPAGVALAEETPGVIALLREIEATVHQVGGLETGTLRVGAFTSASAALVVPALTLFSDRHPEMELSYVEGDPEDCLPRLRGGELDVVVTYEYDLVPRPPDAGLRSVPLMRDPFLVALPVDHPLAGSERVALEDLRDARWVGEPRGDCHLFTLRACALHGFEALVDFCSSDYAVSIELLRACGAVALVPALAVRDPPPGIAIRPLRDSVLARRIDATHRAGGERLPAVAAMVAALTDAGRAAEGELAA